VASGLFAKHGLEVEILEPAPGPANVERVASGAVDFCLTSVSHFLRAQQRRPQAARFVSVVVQRSPMAGFVPADSWRQVPADLGNARLGGRADNELVLQYQAALRHRGRGPAPLVPVAYADAPAALGSGRVDVVADYIDLMPRTRRQAGIPLRAIPVGPEAYSSGLVAGDTVAADLVAIVREAICAALEEQRGDPEWGLSAFCARYPEVDPFDARAGWALAVPNIFTGAVTGSMNATRWRFTLEHLATAYGLAVPAGAAVYREEFLSPGAEVLASGGSKQA
jgi:hypothetical protein